MENLYSNDYDCTWCKYVIIDEEGYCWCKRGYPKESYAGTFVSEKCPKEFICEYFEEIQW